MFKPKRSSTQWDAGPGVTSKGRVGGDSLFSP